ncbi:MAG: periplasmic heavy metal sensor [candidate division WOR-3 bacterium]
MRTRKMTAMALALVLGVLTAGWAVAQPATMDAPAPVPRERPEHMMGRVGPMMPQLSEEQQQQMDNLRLAHLKEVLPLETDLEIKQMELGALWRAEKLDAAKVVAKVKEINELRNRLELARVNHVIARYNVLTPEQRKQAQPFFGMGEGRGRMRRAMGRMRGMGGQGTMCPECPMHKGM